MAMFGSTATASAVPNATLKGSKAIAPPGAPREVKQMIHAGNQIRHEPYVYGGGHQDWNSHGYDCSGSVSYVLHGAGLLDYPLDSTGFMHWGRKSASKWVTIYANHEHAFMVVAGLRFDTSYITDGDKSGPGWSEEMRPTDGFRVRSPAGVSSW
jgi:cell wall-associated NlpC family hydrolase